MSGVTPLLDTLLATRLAQRVDLVPLKPAAQIAGPGELAEVEGVSNDVRLPSRAALQQQLGPGLSHKADGAPTAAGGAVNLSAAARAVSAVLGLSSAVDGKIRGAEPLWPFPQQPSAQLLAASLSQTVASSGLFYESHLRQFAAGTRTLAQLVTEPQAALDTTPKMPPAAVLTPHVRSAGADLAPVVGLPVAVADPIAAAIHPEAVTLVRQQLELLALPVFRWAGEAWPGTPLTLNIHQEDGEEEAHRGEDGDAATATWVTSLRLSLPSLGVVEVRLRVAGDTLQLQLAAAETATVVLLGQCGNVLSQRLDALGLALTGLQVSALEITENSDAT